LFVVARTGGGEEGSNGYPFFHNSSPKTAKMVVLVNKTADATQLFGPSIVHDSCCMPGDVV
jgi:hypothetical protein